ncbi:MAG: hypothetical protein ACRD1B_10725 [Thermoanaerobaculia bacterium]
MATIPRRLAVLLFLAPVLLLLSGAGVEAQDKWSFVFTPQVWFENIRNNGFAGATNAGGALANVGGFRAFGEFPSNDLDQTGFSPNSTFYPQWGGQFAAQYERWTFAVAAQFVSFESSNTTYYTNARYPICFYLVTGACVVSPLPGFPASVPVAPAFVGTKAYTETINTDRADVDLTASYFFPDVIKDLMDVTTGLGFKMIRASGHRQLNVNPESFQVFYILNRNGCQANISTPATNPSCLSSRASFLDQFYGATIPTTLNFRLTNRGNWLMPVTMTPFLGAEIQSDDVTGSFNGFAYGGTFDIGVRYVFSNGVAVYGGWRGQAIQGNNLFFAQGPVLNLSVPLGGK